MLASMLFVLKKAISTLVLPPAGLLLLAAAGLALVRRHRRAGMTMIACGLLPLFALCLPAVSGWLEQSTYCCRNTAPPTDVGAIVVLGAGTYDNLIDYDGETVNGWALERVRAGARLAKQTGLPVLVSGGVVWRGTPEGELMRQAMAEFGVTVRWVESASRDTADNARMSAALLKAAGISRVALVTHAMHMRRSMAEFRLAGLEPVAAPTVIRRPPDMAFTDFIPSARCSSQAGRCTNGWAGWRRHCAPPALSPWSSAIRACCRRSRR